MHFQDSDLVNFYINICISLSNGCFIHSTVKLQYFIGMPNYYCNIIRYCSMFSNQYNLKEVMRFASLIRAGNLFLEHFFAIFL